MMHACQVALGMPWFILVALDLEPVNDERSATLQLAVAEEPPWVCVKREPARKWPRFLFGFTSTPGTKGILKNTHTQI